MPSSTNLSIRIWILDIARGFSIILMIIAHTIDFFYVGNSPLLHGLKQISNTVIFSSLFFLSGATAYIAYLHHRHPRVESAKRIIKRLSIYIVGYYALAIFILAVSGQLTSDGMINVISFQKLVPYTEFIPVFILLGILKIPLHSLLQRSARSWFSTLVLSTVVVFIGQLVKYSSLPLGIKLLLVGKEGWYSFPLLWYAPLYLIGIYIGRKIWYHQSRKSLHKNLAAIVLGSIVILSISVLYSSMTNTILFSRWPPTVAFIAVGLLFSVSVLCGISALHNLGKFPWTRNLLLLFGQNAFAIFFTHTAIIFAFHFIRISPVHSVILITAMMFLTAILSIYFAKIIPLNYSFDLTFIRWCECQLHYCSHAKEHQIIQRLKSHAIQILDLPRAFSFNLGKRKINLINPRHFTVGFGILLLTAVPLGFAENSTLIHQAIMGIDGNLSKVWLLKPGTSMDQTTFSINLPQSILAGSPTYSVTAQIDQDGQIPMSKINDNVWQASFSAANLQTGDHSVHAIISINNAFYETTPQRFFVSAPLLVSWTIDWEGYDVPNEYLDEINKLATSQNIPMTQLFNPRIYTDPEFNQDRAEYITHWVKNRSNIFGDEIGLHLHMFPDFVEDAGINPRLEPAWGGGFTKGYDVLTTAYSRQEMRQILKRAKWWYSQQGLPTPTTYRAGAWFANEETLQALIDEGFTIDSSGRTAYSFGTNGIAGEWSLSTTSQPYFPSAANQNLAGDDQRQLLEIPNNGADSFAYSGEDMIDRFDQNYLGGTISTPTQVTYLSHPHWYKPSRQLAMKQVFEYIGKYANEKDTGPVVFATLSEIAQFYQQ